MRTPTLALVLAAAAALVAGCVGGPSERKEPMPPTPSPASSPTPSPAREPDRIAVDHILIGVRNPRFPSGKRTESEARAFAYDLLGKLKAGEDWAAAKSTNSEDPPPGGPYAMANRGVAPAPTGEYPREGMVPAFGDVGFKLAVGEVGMADYDATKSPFGFHIIKRVR